MKSNRFIFVLVITLSFAIVGAGISLIFSKFIDFSNARGIETIPQKSIAAKKAGGAVVFNPPLPQDAPANIKDAVMLGYNILTDTEKYAGPYVGNKLICSNCHFKGGMTEGGRNGGLSLVGVAASYPEYKKRQDYSVDLVTRTNDCFQRSMNGKPLPADSKEMIAIVTYYQWISKGLPIYADIPWLGVQHLKSAHKPDHAKGKQVFAQKCFTCHGDNGQGTLAAPPLWGKDSFNDGAGMAKLDNLAAFAHSNMPLGNPDLSVEDALDVAAFVTTRTRPHFTEKTKQGD
ncbi:MAG: c-type cytochrome [Syntrophales bacterium]